MELRLGKTRWGRGPYPKAMGSKDPDVQSVISRMPRLGAPSLQNGPRAYQRLGPRPLTDFLVEVFLLSLMFVYFRERESRGEAEREVGQRIRSRLCTNNRALGAGLDLTNHELVT